MSQADKLLESLTSEPGNIASGNIVIGDDCFITVPESLKKLAVQYDHNVETVTFDCPRYRDGHDMFKMKIYVNYLRSDGVLGTHLCSNVTLDDNDSNLMHFDWTVSGHATYAAGDLSFLVCIKDVDKDGNEKFHWNSELNTETYVSPGMKCTDVILAKHPDIITQLLTRMDGTETFVKDMTVDAVALDNGEATVEKTEVGDSMKLTFGLPKGNPGASAYQVWLDAGNTGTVEEFLATLSGSAYEVWLSLGNTGTEADFIASLKGKDGVSTTHSWDGTVLSVTSASGTSSTDLKGGPGQNGVTFMPSVDDEGNLSWTNDGELENPETVNIKGPRGDSANYEGTPIVEANSTDGVTYTATVDGMDSLVVGKEIIIIPDCTSTSTTPTLNVNSLGAKNIRCQLPTNSSTSAEGPSTGFLVITKPVKVRWNGTYWIADITRPNNAGFSGKLLVEHGGTGLDTLTSGSYLIGNGTGNVTLKSPAEVASDIAEQLYMAEGDLPYVYINDTNSGFTINYAKWMRRGNFFTIGIQVTLTAAVTDALKITAGVPQAISRYTIPATAPIVINCVPYAAISTGCGWDSGNNRCSMRTTVSDFPTGGFAANSIVSLCFTYFVPEVTSWS